VNGALLDTIARTVRSETVVTRSRFIATLAPVADEAAADDMIAAVRREFHDARHHCTAMVLGPAGQRQRSNDDGEPAGTAGAPMLAVLRGSELTDVEVIDIQVGHEARFELTVPPRLLADLGGGP
jgi:putative IMPACT (imprinted ancient) family translation regulator